jgi:ComF family protein
MQIFSDLLDFLFPKTEEVYSLEGLSAADLLQKLPAATDLGEDTLAIWNYAEPRVRELIWELKYRGNRILVQNVAHVLSDLIRQELAERALFENFTNPLLLGVPQSSKRKLERGFNQTEIICESLDSLSREEGAKLFEYRPNILTKPVHTESQTLTKNKRARLQNVDHSMKVVIPSEVEGRNIILIDDVTTTGATFKEARRALRAAGSKKVLCIALTH